MHDEPKTPVFEELEAPLELSIQMLEPLDAPGWATWGGRAVSVSLVSAAYT